MPPNTLSLPLTVRVHCIPAKPVAQLRPRATWQLDPSVTAKKGRQQSNSQKNEKEESPIKKELNDKRGMQYVREKI